MWEYRDGYRDQIFLREARARLHTNRSQSRSCTYISMRNAYNGFVYTVNMHGDTATEWQTVT